MDDDHASPAPATSSPSSAPAPRWPRAVLALALAVQLLVGLYGIAQEIVWGHYGFHMGEYGGAAVHLRRHGTFVLSTVPDFVRPTRAQLNFHHPYLLHQYLAASQALFGEKPWAVRVVPLAFSFAALLGLWSLAKRARDERTAALAALVFVLDPLHASFCLLPDHQIVAITWALWSGVGLLAALRAPRAGPIALWLAGAALAGLTDWPWYTIAFAVFLVVLYQVRPGGTIALARTPREVRALRFALAGFALIVATTFVQHLVVARLMGEFGQATGSYMHRAGGMPLLLLGQLIVQRFGLLHAAVLPLLALAWLGEAVARRRKDPGTLLVGAMFVGAGVETGIFRWGFAFHEYRTYWYVPVFAFAAADCVVRAAAWLRARRGERSALGRRALPVLACALAVVLAAVMLPVMVLSRQRGGAVTMRNYDDNLDDLLLARAARIETGRDGRLFVGGSLEPRQEFIWLLDGPWEWLTSVDQARVAFEQQRRVVVVDRRGPMLGVPAWRSLIQRGRLLIVGDAALLVLAPRQRPSFELARVVRPTRRAWWDAWLHAAWGGPARLVPASREETSLLAREVHEPMDVLGAVAAGETPLLDSLPIDLVGASRR